jgi:hypothetical protein
MNWLWNSISWKWRKLKSIRNKWWIKRMKIRSSEKGLKKWWIDLRFQPLLMDHQDLWLMKTLNCLNKHWFKTKGYKEIKKNQHYNSHYLNNSCSKLIKRIKSTKISFQMGISTLSNKRMRYKGSFKIFRIFISKTITKMNRLYKA